MHEWVVAGAVISTAVADSASSKSEHLLSHQQQRPDSPVLLVQNQRASGHTDWTPPGGVIDANENVLIGLGREVEEETGLVVTDWARQLYRIEVVAEDMGWSLSVEVHEAAAVQGSLAVGNDPDGIVVAADWVGPHLCHDRLLDTQQWVREPLVEWLSEQYLASRLYRYAVRGTDFFDCAVTRLSVE